MAGKPEYDEITGQYTTGHEWDGLKELNTPLPRWWVWIFIVTVIWSVGYYWFMPAWPMLESYTKGALGWSARGEVMDEIANAKAKQSVYVERINSSDMLAITQDPELLDFAMAGGKSAFGLFCAQCHGSGASGASGIANLNDDDWIWGGTLDDIHETIRVGVRSEHDETRYNMMPNFIKDGMMSKADASLVADYVLTLASGTVDVVDVAEPVVATDAAMASPTPVVSEVTGATLFQDNCESCHGVGGVGMPEMGGVRLNDAIWLYGSTKDDIMKQMTTAQHGMMPSWETRLNEATIKQLTVYVHSLGGGQ